MSGRSAAGLRVWLLQRFSAVYLAVYLLFAGGYLLLHPRPDYAEWRAWFAHPVVMTGSAGFLLALLLHGWIGLRDVILDYVHHLGLRLAALSVVAFLLIACGLWSMRILILAGS